MGNVNVAVLSIIAGYNLVAVALGVRVSRKVTSTSNFLIAGGKMGFLVLGVNLTRS